MLAMTGGLGKQMELKHVTKRYGKNEVVKDVNLTIEKGDFVTILGPSGAGKSTILKMISGFEDISEGQILVDGKDIVDREASQRNFGMLFQNYALFPHMTVEENIAYPLKIRKIEAKQRKEMVENILEVVNLKGYNKRYPKELSGGQQQRVAMARTIVFNPLVLLLDEPMAALDKQLRKQMQREIRKIHQDLGLTTISVTHDQEEALTMANKICVMRDGQICQISTPEDLYEHPNSRFIANFIGESTILDGHILSIDDDQARVQLKDGKIVPVQLGERTSWFHEGQDMYLVLRPERFRMVQADFKGIVLPGFINQSTYVGDAYYLEIESEEGLMLRVQTYARGKYDLRRGAPIKVGFYPKDLIPVAE